MNENISNGMRKLDWSLFLDRTINVTMNENYGVVYGDKKDDSPVFYEIVFKTGKLIDYFDDALLIEAIREKQTYKIFIPFSSIKCVEIF
jgi:hypothetical protein